MFWNNFSSYSCSWYLYGILCLKEIQAADLSWNPLWKTLLFLPFRKSNKHLQNKNGSYLKDCNDSLRPWQKLVLKELCRIYSAQANDRLHKYLKHSQDLINQNFWEQRIGVAVLLQFLLKGPWEGTIRLDLDYILPRVGKMSLNSYLFYKHSWRCACQWDC